MIDSRTAWTRVWQDADAQGRYAFAGGRFERALDKLSHFETIGVRFEKNERVLEAGCGDGAVILSLQRLHGVDGYGADFAESAQAQARRLMEEERLEFNFILSDIRDLPCPDNHFDKVICLGVVEHMADPVRPIRELRRVLRPGGLAIVMTPNRLSAGRLDRILKQRLGTWHMGFQDEFSPQALAGFLRQAGFESVDRMAIRRPALANDSWSRVLVSHLDDLVRRFYGNWGFYSYTWARKG